MAIDKSLELGSPEAAVRSCTELMSMLFEQPVDKVAYYLDLYYQVRYMYEKTRAQNRPWPDPYGGFMPTSTPVPPAYPARRRTMNEPTAPEAEEEGRSSGEDGPPRASAPTEETAAVPGAEQEREAKFEEILSSVNAGGSPGGGAKGAQARQGRGSKSSGNHHAADAAAEKRRIRDRLMQMREAGLSSPAIIKASNGAITHEQIHDILDAVTVPIAVYRVLDVALEQCAAAPPGN